jgi:LysM repeat protein
MHHRKGWAALVLLIMVLGSLRMSEGVLAAPWWQSGPAELINAVNGLRLANGLSALSMHPILMQSAQSQSDALLATEGAVGHTRPNGMTFTQQLLLLGYPLSGDLSLGGYRSENFIFGYQLSAQDAVQAWLGDAPHTNTMLSAERSDIGAGVSVAGDGTVYYVIDTALSTASGLPQSEAELYLPGGPNGAVGAEDAISQYVVPIVVGTARPNGDVYHSVQYGQTLWGIAIEYGTKIDQIRALNNLGSDNTVYPNQLLLVMRGATQPAIPPTAAQAQRIEASAQPVTEIAALSLPAATQAMQEESGPTAEAPARATGPSAVWLAWAVMLLLVAGGISAVWFIREPSS